MIPAPATMCRRLCWSAVMLLTVTTSLAQRGDQSRWSRQLSSYTSDISDWVPLTAPIERSDSPQPPIKRQAVAQPRILSEPFPGFARPTGFSQDFPPRSLYQPSNNRQLYLQSVPSAPQNFLTEQGFGHNLRFGLSQPNYPLSQGFVAPGFPFENTPQLHQRPHINEQQLKFESFPKTTLPVSPQAKPFGSPQLPKAPKQEYPQFVDGYRAENFSTGVTFPNSKKKPQSLQKLKLDTSPPKSPEPSTSNPQKSKLEREEVQLLYVPVESLNRGQFNFRSPLNNQQVLGSDIYSPGIPKPTTYKQAFTSDFQRPIVNPVEKFSFGHDYFPGFNSQFREQDQIPKFSSVSTPFPTIISTTSKPKKLKPHQPPLAVFLAQEQKKGDNIKVADVLTTLKNAKTIAVLDSLSPAHSPNVFIGPSSLSPPESYVKFELPYLSNIEHSDKKLRQLPFFVAPLSYNTPDGFAKIPFPSPHVGSVIVNSQIKDNPSLSTPVADIYPNSYTASPPTYKQTVAQKPTFSYYSTVPPKANSPPSQIDSNYYSFEPQTVTSIRPDNLQGALKNTEGAHKNPSYFLNSGSGYHSDQHGQFIDFPSPLDQVDPYSRKANDHKTTHDTESPTTSRTTATTSVPSTTKVSSTSKSSSTYPSQLLETHNPYSINQAFHMSTPLDYQNYFEEYKEGAVTPGLVASSPLPKTSTQQEVASKQTYAPPSSTYLNNYSPEIHYGPDEIQTSRFPIHDSNVYTTKSEPNPEVSSQYNRNSETQTPVTQRNPPSVSTNEIPTTASDADVVQSTRSPSVYNQYVSNSYDYKDVNAESAETTTTSTTTTSTTTTRRTPLRSRGRPHRYSTPRTDSSEGNTKSTTTRRPLRERRPLPSRPKYEPNKITTEKPTRKPVDTNEGTPKSPRIRQRGRVNYKQAENTDDNHENKRQKSQNKDQDLAYQRDVLHQNYPVTLMERMSTVDIEAITDSPPALSSTRDLNRTPVTEVYESEQSHSVEKIDIPTFSSKVFDDSTEAPSYVPRLPSTRNDEHIYQSRSSPAHIDAMSYSDDTEDNSDQYTPRPTAPVSRNGRPEVSQSTESQSPTTEQAVSRHSNEYSSSITENLGATVRPDFEITKINNLQLQNSYEIDSKEQSTEESLPETLVPHNYRVKVRPGPLRNAQTSTTETPAGQGSYKTRMDSKKRPVQPVTYRPAYDRRRTTMRIDEIEADLKTKSVHARQESLEHRHPVYKPEPTTEPIITTASSESTTKRGQFRRRRPQTSYSTLTTSTESSAERKKQTYEVRNRHTFRGRRPTEKSTEKTEIKTDVSSTTIRSIPYSRYSNRPKLSERFNKKPVVNDDQDTETEDQDRNYSINRPKYAVPDVKSFEDEKWSPKMSIDSFKPYNPNDISDEKKIATTEKRSNDEDDGELDIITARNEYDDILISVTPASNRVNKKIPEIPPTLEALVEQSKSAKVGSEDKMSTFESMLEEVMKSLEEQDEDEYTANVMKHKGGEIGEIPPERVISSGESYSTKSTTLFEQDLTTETNSESETTSESMEKEDDQKTRRRGFWKKVKVRPVTTESFEVAESQFYSNTVNRLGNEIKPSKTIHQKNVDNGSEKLKPTVTTYKPKISLKDLKDTDNSDQIIAHKFSEVEDGNDEFQENVTLTVNTDAKEHITTTLKSSTLNVSPGEVDLGTGTPDPTVMDMFYSTPTTESTSELSSSILDRSDGFSLMDYLFGVTSPDTERPEKVVQHEKSESNKETFTNVNSETTESFSAAAKTNAVTTESSYIPEEVTAVSSNEEDTEKILTNQFGDIKKINSTDDFKKDKDNVVREDSQSTEVEHGSVETSTASSFLDPKNVVSTSMSTEISHETEICFRGKCIKASNDAL